MDDPTLYVVFVTLLVASILGFWFVWKFSEFPEEGTI